MRKKLVLPDALNTRVIKMIKAGDKPRVIKKHAKDNYNLELPGWKIQGIKRDIKLGRKKRLGHSPKSAKPAPEIKPEGTAQEIKNLVDIMVDNQNAILLDIRLQLIKECNKGFRIRRSMGHDVPDDLK